MNNHNLSLYEQLKFFGKTQQTFAHDVGVSLTSVNRWLNRHFKPSKLAQERIREVLERYEKEHEEKQNQSNVSPAANGYV